jgi:hydrogenase maturation protein HypF
VERLCDAVAVLVGLGGAANQLEHLAASVPPDDPYPLPIVDDGLLMGDTRHLVSAILADLRAGTDSARIARRFHEALVAFGVAQAERARIRRVALVGDAFDNRLLAERLEERLGRLGFEVHVPTLVATNDGGVSVGQAWLAAQHALRSRSRA